MYIQVNRVKIERRERFSGVQPRNGVADVYSKIEYELLDSRKLLKFAVDFSFTINTRGNRMFTDFKLEDSLHQMVVVGKILEELGHLY